MHGLPLLLASVQFCTIIKFEYPNPDFKSQSFSGLVISE
jgi:hypothetical protein